MEEDAARAYNVEAARHGYTLNVVPPADAAGTGTGIGDAEADPLGYNLSVVPPAGGAIAGGGAGAGAGHILNIIPNAGAAGAGAGTGGGADEGPGVGDAQQNKKMKLHVALG